MKVIPNCPEIVPKLYVPKAYSYMQRSFNVIVLYFAVTGDCTPGPGSYKIGTTIGKSVAKSICGRQVIKKSRS